MAFGILNKKITYSKSFIQVYIYNLQNMEKNYFAELKYENYNDREQLFQS